MNKFLLVLFVLLPWGLAAQAKIDEPGLKALLARDKGVVLLDVRTSEEFATGHLPGSLLLPFDAINAASAAKLIPTKKTTVVVYCRSGRRSALAAQTLVGLGYTKVLDFGAVDLWRGALVR